MLSKSELQAYRSNFPHLDRPYYYLDHAAFGVLSTKVIDSINNHLTDRSVGSIMTFMSDKVVIERVREKLARLINAPSPDNISFTTNTSEGLSLIASGFRWDDDDRILINDAEFPSNVYPFLNAESYEVEVDFVQSKDGFVTPEMIEAELHPNTRMVSVSAVQFLSGYKIDLAKTSKIVHDNGAFFIVDAIQAVGNSRIDVQAMNIDGLSCGALKWLMAPMGIGFVYISDELREIIDQQYVGWLSVEEPWQLSNFDQDLNPTGRRYELGGLNVPGIYALDASIDPFLEIGVDRIHVHLLGLSDQIDKRIGELNLKRFTILDESCRTGIITYNLPDHINGDELIEVLKSRNVVISHRQGKVRFSPHFYNTIEDINSAMDIFIETYKGFI